ncbi:MAG: hypothetical protein WC661_10590 [Opitutaceae bacterium]|jgi:hypothetical protein
MLPFKGRPIVLAAAVFALASSAQALVVNVDFDYATNGSGTYSGQGAYSDPGNNFWNSIHYLNVDFPPVLKASDGSTDTGITVSISGYPDAFDFSGGGDPGPLASSLMQDYLYTYNNGSSPVLFSIGGLTAGETYQFYFYSAVGGNNSVRDRQAVFTLDGVSQNVNGYSSVTGGSALYSLFVLGDNYLEFTVTPTGTSLAGSFYTPTSGEAEFNGLQIVQIPEPSTCAWIAGLGVLVLAIANRPKSRSPNKDLI